MELAESCDAMVVVGGMHSANSRHLVKLCAEKCGQVVFTANAESLDLVPLVAFDTIGVTAGASVPDRIIKEVKQKMCDEIKEITTAETEKSFDELIEESLKPIYNGDTVKGIVVAITQTEVTVDLGTKHSGYIPVEDFEDGTGVKVADVIKVGDEVSACVVRVNDVEGTVMLSSAVWMLSRTGAIWKLQPRKAPPLKALSPRSTRAALSSLSRASAYSFPALSPACPRMLTWSSSSRRPSA